MLSIATSSSACGATPEPSSKSNGCELARLVAAADCDVRRPALRRPDAVPVLVDDRDRLVGDHAGGDLDSLYGLDLCEYGFRHCARERFALAELALDLDLGSDCDIDVGVDLGEELVEGAVDRVGQHQRPGDHGDAEEHGKRRRQGPQLASAEVAKGEDGHRSRAWLRRSASAAGPARTLRPWCRSRPCRRRGRQPGRRRRRRAGRG